MTCPHCGRPVGVSGPRGVAISPPPYSDHLMSCPVLFEDRQARRRADFARHRSPTHSRDVMADRLGVAARCLDARALAEGRAWWPRESARIAQLADAYRVAYRSVAYAAAALSPGLRWEATLDVVRLLLDARARGETSYPRGSGHLTFGYRDRAKAWRILTEDAWALCTGPKVEAIAANLTGDLTRAAVDRHIIRIATGRPELRQVSPAATKRIEAALVSVAAGVGLLPGELQAALWVEAAR